jgi:glycosyltransferase involved in cell wall biosynthesis
MSIGLPAVASSFGGNPNMVRDGVNGYIYKAGDFMALAERIEKIASDRALYERLSEGAMSLYEAEFNSDKMTRETESFYAELYEKNIKSLIEAGDSELG